MPKGLLFSRTVFDVLIDCNGPVPDLRAQFEEGPVDANKQKPGKPVSVMNSEPSYFEKSFLKSGLRFSA